MRCRGFWILLGFVTSGGPLFADGSIEIHQDCVAIGCFHGDDPGWPIEINAPGRYRLTSNLVVSGVSPVRAAIRIFADSVSLDLGGFEIRGPTSCVGNEPICFRSLVDSAIRAISEDELQSVSGLQLENGSVRGFGDDCIELFADNVVVERLRVSDCGNRGILLTGSGMILQVAVADVADAGIVATSSAQIHRSTVTNAGSAGVDGGLCSGIVFSSNGGASGTVQERCTADFGDIYCSDGTCP